MQAVSIRWLWGPHKAGVGILHMECQSYVQTHSRGQVHVGWLGEITRGRQVGVREHLRPCRGWLRPPCPVLWLSSFEARCQPLNQGSDREKSLRKSHCLFSQGWGAQNCSQDTFHEAYHSVGVFQAKPKGPRLTGVRALIRHRSAVWVAEVRALLLASKEPEIWLHFIFQLQMIGIGSLGMYWEGFQGHM